MRELNNDSWKLRGSSVIFHHPILNSLIASQVSLRQALSWFENLPSEPPVKSRTMLIMGLETILETLEPPDAEDFLLKRIQPLLRHLQNRWDSIGILLGFNSSPQTFKISVHDESLLFSRRDKNSINLSNGLWDGSAPSNMLQIQENGVTIGYHVSRIS
jgi:hypothetical protein